MITNKHVLILIGIICFSCSKDELSSSIAKSSDLIDQSSEGLEGVVTLNQLNHELSKEFDRYKTFEYFNKLELESDTKQTFSN